MTSQITQVDLLRELVGKSACDFTFPGTSSDQHSLFRRRLSRSKHDVSGTVGQASWLSSVINLLNTIVGAGVLAMPLAMSHMGIVLGTIVILWSGTTAGFGLYLQTRCAKYLERGSSSFFALSQITYPNAAVIFDAAIAVKCFGVGVSYLIIIGDLMPGVVRGFSDEDGLVPFLVDRHFWVTAFMLVVIPLSFLRRLDSLKYTSVIALISIGYLVILVVYHFAARDTFEGARPPVRVVHWAGAIQTLSSFPVIVFAYTCHQNMFSILNEISNNSYARTTAVVVVSNGTAAAIYILVAITGYLSFGNDIGGNIVAQYAPSVSATIGRAAIVVLVMFSYPLQVHPCRASVDAVLKWRPKSISKSSGPSSVDSSPPRNVPLLQAGKKRNLEELGETRFAAITTVIIILSYLVAMAVSSLEAVLAYVGSTGSTSISFILPGLFYYKISSPDSPLHQQLLKEEDDYDADEEDGEGQEDEGLLGGSGMLTASGILKRSNLKLFRRQLLRKLSLALAIYGVLVMITCLITNTFFLVAH
jgi:amino acid permease